MLYDCLKGYVQYPLPLQKCIVDCFSFRLIMAWRWQRSAILALLLISSLFPCGGYADDEEAIVDDSLVSYCFF